MISKPDWVVSKEDERLFDQSVSYGIPLALLSNKASTENYVHTTNKRRRGAAAGPHISGIALNIEKGQYLKAFHVGLILAPFETITTLSGFGLVFLNLYCKTYVQWRHARLPYTEAQLAMRKTLTTKLIRQRTFWGFAGLSWILDKCRLIQYID